MSHPVEKFVLFFNAFAAICICGYAQLPGADNEIEGSRHFEGALQWDCVNWEVINDALVYSNSETTGIRTECNSSKYVISRYVTPDGCTVTALIMQPAVRSMNVVNIQSAIDSVIVKPYPNPSNSGMVTLLIGLPSSIEDIIVVLYDLMGKEVQRLERHAAISASIDVHGLSKGIYIYRVYATGTAAFVSGGRFIVN